MDLFGEQNYDDCQVFVVEIRFSDQTLNWSTTAILNVMTIIGYDEDEECGAEGGAFKFGLFVPTAST